MTRRGLPLPATIVLMAIAPTHGGPPETRPPTAQQQAPAGDELRISVVGQRFVTKVLPYKTFGRREVSYRAREVVYRVSNVTDHDVFFVSTEPLPINLAGTRISQSLCWPVSIRVHHALVPVPTVTRIAPGKAVRFTYAYAQDGQLDVEFAYASKLDEKSLRTLFEIEGRVLEANELNWFRGVARRHCVEVAAIEEKPSAPVRVMPRSYLVYQKSHRKFERVEFTAHNTSGKPIVFLWTGATPGERGGISAFVSQSLRWTENVKFSRLPRLHGCRLEPGDRLEFECGYEYERGIVRTNFAYFENPSPDDWERLSKFDRLNGINTYGPDRDWLLDSTSIVQVEFAVPSVPDDEVKDFKESKHVRRPKVVKSESEDREAQREDR